MEPRTGITMAAAARLQVSSYFDASYPAFDPTVVPTVLPMYWAEELAEASEEDARKVQVIYEVRKQRCCCI